MQDTAAGAVKAQFPALVGGMLKNIWNQPQGVFSVKGGRDSVDVFSDRVGWFELLPAK